MVIVVVAGAAAVGEGPGPIEQSASRTKLKSKPAIAASRDKYIANETGSFQERCAVIPRSGLCEPTLVGQNPGKGSGADAAIGS